MVGVQQPDRSKVGVHRGGHLFRELADGHAALHRALDDLVVDVGDVAHVDHIETGGAQPAVDDVKCHVHAQVPHVAHVVDGDAAHVHPHLAGHQRLKIFDGSAEGVVDAQGHGKTATRGWPATNKKPRSGFCQAGLIE